MSAASNATPFSANCSSGGHPPTSHDVSIVFATVYALIAMIGVIGNSSIIYIIAGDRKMRATGTNLFILNMAIADLIVMLIGVEELVSYVIARGWLLGPIACKLLRFSMTSCLYASVITLTAVCIER